jgi:hypothetical protein
MGLSLFMCKHFADDLIYFAFVPWCISPRNTITSHQKHVLEMKIYFHLTNKISQKNINILLKNCKVSNSL